MFNVVVPQKRISVLHEIFGNRFESGGYITPAVPGSGPGWQQLPWEKSIWLHNPCKKAWIRAPYRKWPKKLPPLHADLNSL